MEENKKMEVFVPLITGGAGDSRKAMKSALRSLYDTLLRIESVALAVAKYKSNGSPTGHKVLDDGAAVEAIAETAPEELLSQLKAIKLTQWEQCQIMNQVLRRHFEFNKAGKVTARKLTKSGDGFTTDIPV